MMILALVLNDAQMQRADVTTIIVSLVISLVLSGIAYALTPRPHTSGEKLAISLPQALEGEPIPYVFGTVDCKGTFIWPRSAAHMDKRRISRDSGDRWRLSFAIAYGWGVMDAIHEIRADDCTIWKGPLFYDPTTMPGGYAEITTTRGTVRVFFGTPGQVADPHIHEWEVLGQGRCSRQGNLGKSNIAPRFKDVAYIVFSCFNTGFSPTVPNITVRWQRTPASPLTDAHKTITTGTSPCGDYVEANPVHVLADIATNALYGSGMPASELDAETWNAAAERLHDEGLGISGVLDSQTTLADFFRHVLSHIDAGVVPRANGIAFKLLRGDDEQAVIAIPEAAISDWNYQPGSPAQVVNHITVEYRDRRRFYAPSTFPMFDVAGVLATDNTKREPVRLPFFTDERVARIAAQRKAQFFNTQHDSLSFKVDERAGVRLEWGDAIAPQYPRDGFDGTRVFRIVNCTPTPGSDPYITVDAIEEIGMVNANYYSASPIDGEDIDEPILGPLELARPIEPPLELNPLEVLQASYLAARRQSIYTRFILQGGLTASLGETLTANGRFVPASVLAHDYEAGTLEIDDVGLLLDSSVDVPEFAADASVDREQLFNRVRLLLAGQEVMAFQTIEPESGKFRVSGIIRGLFDTRAAFHPAGTPCYILPLGAMPFLVGPRAGWVPGISAHFRAVPYNEAQSGAAADFDTHELPLRARFARPRTPEGLVADGNGSNPVYAASASVRLGWVHRNRRGGFGILTGFGENADVEAGIDFVVRVYDDADALLSTHIVPASQTYEDDYGVTRHYFDFAMPDKPHVTAKINPRLGGLESDDALSVAALAIRRA